MSDVVLPDLPTIKKNAPIRFALSVQNFLLRRDWAGGMGDFVMVLVHRGRKSGKSYETPVAYLREGKDLLAISNGKLQPNWVLNALAAGEVEVVIKGKSQRVRFAMLSERAEINAAFDHFVATYKGFDRAFRVKRDSPRPVLEAARDRMIFMRLSPV